MQPLDAFLGNDIGVSDATSHLWADLDRDVLLAARRKPSRVAVAKALAVLENTRSALALEAFVARPLSRLGAEQECLAARLRALALTPRWEPWQCSVVLGGLTRSLLRVGRASDALAVAREAVRHAPLDPYALRELARACDANGAAEGATIRAWLRDRGFGPPIVADTVADDERGASATIPGIEGAAPLDDESLARFAVLREVDSGFTARRSGGLRTVMAQIRRGDVGGALCTTMRDEGDSGLWTVVDGWLGLGASDALVYTALGVARETLRGTKAGAEASRRWNGRAPHIHWRGLNSHFVTTLPRAELEPVLLHDDRQVMLAAHRCLPDHPIVRRYAALREGLLRTFPLAEPLAVFAGAGGCRDAEGRAVAYPVLETSTRPSPGFPPLLEAVTDRKSKCARCGERLAEGELALAITKLDRALEAKTKRWHPACAREDAKLSQALERARARQR